MTHVTRWGVLAAMLLLIGAAPADDARKSAPPSQEQAKDRVLAALLARNLDLERKNAELQSQVHELQARLVMTANPQILPDGNRVPENWQRRRFNGLPYYLVPLGMDRSTPTTRPTR